MKIHKGPIPQMPIRPYSSKMMLNRIGMARKILSLCLGAVFPIASVSAQVFVDSFNNGTAADSDAQAGFWATNTSNGSGDANAIVESGGVLSMSAGDDDGTNNANYSGVSLISSVSSDFNFFTDTLSFQVRGISFSGSTAADKQQLRLGLTAGGGSYNSPDAVVLRVRGDGTVNLGSKVDIANSNSDGTATHENFDLGADNSLTGFDLTLDPGSGTNIDYTLVCYGGSGNPLFPLLGSLLQGISRPRGKSKFLAFQAFADALA
jgi:hypothetical protein